MKICRIFRQKRGDESLLLQQLSIIAICVAGGALIYSIFLALTHTLTQQAN